MMDIDLVTSLVSDETKETHFGQLSPAPHSLAGCS